MLIACQRLFFFLDHIHLELKRKNKEAQDEISSLDRRRSTLITETQKLRELLNEAQVDRQNLKEANKQTESEHAKNLEQIKERNPTSL